MATLSDVGINQRFSFKVYPTSILGDRYHDVTLEGRVSAQMAQAFGEDILALHTNVYPTLPPGVPDDPFQYDYIQIRFPLTGAREFLGTPWVREDTIEISQGGRVVMTFDNLTSADVDRLRQAVTANGYSPTEVNFTAG